MSAAALRGFFVALLIATPPLMLPGIISDSSQITVLVAIIAFMMIFIEYSSTSPSFIEFRDAPPFNRLRFIALLLMVFGLSAMVHEQSDPSALTGAINNLGRIIGHTLDFPYSPVRLAILMLPENSDAQMVETLRIGAGLTYFISIVTIAIFLVAVRYLSWPSRSGAFNVWVNLPLFDPTSGGDVLYRLQRDARINITLGFLLPFVIPAVIKLAAPIMDPVTLDNPQTLIWTLSAWAFLPTSMIMRGIAMSKVAGMISDKRRRTYASEETDFQAA